MYLFRYSQDGVIVFPGIQNMTKIELITLKYFLVNGFGDIDKFINGRIDTAFIFSQLIDELCVLIY